ncbi:MAG: 2-oxoacid:ferredoxin oxidoreductase subunit beta [Puniceicoccaceae bacterium]|nr:MAG: 2-oxoacid:ferredoxin oxidoreductase subunit beta [Puniceicoccaceae bacterium]
MSTQATEPPPAVFTARDLVTDQDIRWCPGCGDYSILKQVQTVLPELGLPREKIVFVSGIGCSSRFPYYMNTYGMHSIHGRATAIATGLKLSRPDLNVWVVSGDGDSFSIGGNHFIHTLRKNPDLNLLVFNNQIYGLTKGQFSPTSPRGQVTKSSPLGAVEHPFNPAALALGADATFVARSADRDQKHLQAMIRRAAAHRGTSFLEIYQNCNVFNDGAFSLFTDRQTREDHVLYLEHGAPLTFGPGRRKGIRLRDSGPEVVDLDAAGLSESDLWIHDETDLFKAGLLARFFGDPRGIDDPFPRPFGVFYAVTRPTLEDEVHAQISGARSRSGQGKLDALISGENTWEIK